MLNTYLISYDLGAPETRDDYQALINYIKTYPHWAKPLKSVWLIKTEKGSPQVRDELRLRVDNNDKILVIQITNDWATYGVSREVTDWMKKGM